MELSLLVREIMMVSLMFIFLGTILYCTVISDKEPTKSAKN